MLKKYPKFTLLVFNFFSKKINDLKNVRQIKNKINKKDKKCNVISIFSANVVKNYFCLQW